jgi:orotate phosphoribosyltransferase
MRGYKQEFIELPEVGVLRSSVRLKSGQQPYFFNSSCSAPGMPPPSWAHLRRHGRRLEDCLRHASDRLQGHPPRGLTAAALAEHHGRNLPFCFNRKEIKEHGEGGAIVGAPVSGRVLILDDVITAGTAIRETITLLRQAGGEPAGVVIALDRQERGNGELSAIQEVQQAYGIPVASIIRLDDLVEHLESSAQHGQFLPLVQDYRERYGVTA